VSCNSILRRGRGALLLLALSVAVVAGTAHAAQTRQRMAVVNVSYIFEKYKKVYDVQRRIDGSHEAEKNSLTLRIKDLTARNKELQQFFKDDTGSVQIFDAVQKLRKDTFMYQRDLNRLNEEIQRAYTKEMREVLSDIRVAIRAVAERDRFDLVLRSPDSDNPDVKTVPEGTNLPEATQLEITEPKTVAALVERFNRNPVLFGAKTVDITQDVLKKLNDDFDKRATGK
jgi:Skp family chaperone for outer membrane proteins